MNKCYRCGIEHNGAYLTDSCPKCNEEINQKIKKKVRENKEWHEQNIIHSRFEILDL